MNAWLVIFLTDSLGEKIVWREIDADNNIVGLGSGSLSDITTIQVERTAIVVPGFHVSCFDEVSVSVKSEKEAKSVAKFAIEDDLAGQLADTHVALAPSSDQNEFGERTMFAVSNNFMRSLIDSLKLNQIEADLVVADYMCLEKSSDSAKTIISKDFLSICYGNWGVSVDSSLGSEFVNSLLTAKKENLQLDCVGVYPDVDATKFGFPKVETDAYDIMASNITNVEINLLQGSYEVNSQQKFFKPPNILTLATIVILALIANVGVTFFEISQITSKTSKVTSDTRTLFQQSFPQFGNVRDIRTQLRLIETQTKSGEPDFLILSSLLALGVERVNGVNVQSVRFDANSSELSVNVLFDSFNSLEHLTVTIESLGGIVTDGGSQQAGQRRSGELIIRRNQ